MERLITLKFGHVCHVCKRKLAPGITAYWDKAAERGKRGRCQNCSKPQQQIPMQQPQQSQELEAQPLAPGVTLEKQSNGALWMKLDSLAAAHEQAQRPNPANRAVWENVYFSNDRGGPEKFSVQDAATAKRIIASGEWPEGVERMLATLQRLENDAKPVSSRRHRIRADQGDTLDIHAVYSGRLDRAWERTQRDNRKAPQTLTLVINLTQAWVEHADRLFWRGAAGLLFADMMTAAGYNIEIEATDTGHDLNTRKQDSLHAATIQIKSALAPLDLNALASVVCLAGYFRISHFAVLCSFPVKVDSGLGVPIKYRQALPNDVDTRHVIICEGITNAQEAQEWIAKTIAEVQAG